MPRWHRYTFQGILRPGPVSKPAINLVHLISLKQRLAHQAGLPAYTWQLANTFAGNKISVDHGVRDKKLRKLLYFVARRWPARPGVHLEIGDEKAADLVRPEQLAVIVDSASSSDLIEGFFFFFLNRRILLILLSTFYKQQLEWVSTHCW